MYNNTISISLGTLENNGKSMVRFQIMRGADCCQIDSGYMLKSEDIGQWIQAIDSDTQISGCDKKLVSLRIAWDYTRLQSIRDRLEKTGINVSPADIVKEYSNVASFKHFISYGMKLVDRKNLLGRSGSAENSKWSLVSFLDFLGNNDIAFADINKPLIEEYEAWLLAKGICRNSTSFYMRNLQTIYNQAVQDNLVADVHPFRTVYRGIDKTLKRCLSIAEIRRIKDMEMPPGHKMGEYRDIFFFQFYAMGISFIDAANLKLKNISGNMIVYHRSKTSQTISVPIGPEIAEIIEKYKSEESDYLLPIIDPNMEDKRMQCKTYLRHYNDALKKIGRMADVKVRLTSYVTRHTWASIAQEKGVAINVISDALGHDNVKTTEIYLSTISTDRIAEANRLIFSGL